jgi:hypothetical protein
MRTRRVNLSKHYCCTSERKCLPFKGRFRGSAYVMRCMFTMASGLDSPGVWCHFEALCLGWQVIDNCLV